MVPIPENILRVKHVLIHSIRVACRIERFVGTEKDHANGIMINIEIDADDGDGENQNQS